MVDNLVVFGAGVLCVHLVAALGPLTLTVFTFLVVSAVDQCVSVGALEGVSVNRVCS